MNWTSQFFKAIFLVIAPVFLLSCARTVTDKSFSKTIKFTVTFREPLNTNQYQYLVVFSNIDSPEISLPIVNNQYPYFPTPGRPYDLNNVSLIQAGGIQSLYNQYFFTWKDYVILSQNNKVDRYKGSENGFSKNTQNNTSYLADLGFQYSSTIEGAVWTLSFDLLQLSWLFPKLLDSDRLFFKIATTALLEKDSAGRFMDVNSEAPSLFLRKSELIKKSDFSNSFIDGPADIVSWEVQVY